MQAQATGLKRFSLHGIWGLALAIGIIVSGTLGVAALLDAVNLPGINDDASVASQTTQTYHRPADRGVVSQGSVTDVAPKAYYVPGAGEGLLNPQQSVAPSTGDRQSLEQDLWLLEAPKTSVVPSVIPFETQRFLEMNMLPGDDVRLVPPMPGAPGASY
jgi:hypothetical protein